MIPNAVNSGYSAEITETFLFYSTKLSIWGTRNYYNQLGIYTLLEKTLAFFPFLFRNSLRLFRESSKKTQVSGRFTISRCQRRKASSLTRGEALNALPCLFLMAPRFLRWILLIMRSAECINNRPPVHISQREIHSGRFPPAIISKREKGSGITEVRESRKECLFHPVMGLTPAHFAVTCRGCFN